MPAPDFGTLYDIETQMDDAVVSVITTILAAASVTCAVHKTRGTVTEDTPRVEVNFTLGSPLSHRTTIGQANPKQVPDAYEGQLMVRIVTTRPTNNASHGTIRGWVRYVLTAEARGFNTTILPYIQILDIQPASAPAELYDAKEQDITEFTHNVIIGIRQEAWPVAPIDPVIDQTNLLVELAFDEGSGWALENLKNPDTSNLFAFPEGPFPMANLWTNGGSGTFTNGVADPDGGTNGTRITGLDLYFTQFAKGLTGGETYTMSGYFNSSSGLAQDIRFIADDFLAGVLAVPSTGWVRLSKTFVAGGATVWMGVASDGITPANINFYGLKLEVGLTPTDYTANGNFRLIGADPQWTAEGLNFNGGSLRGGGAPIHVDDLSAVSIYAVFKWPEVNEPSWNAHVGVLGTQDADTPQIFLSAGGGWGASSTFPCGRFRNSIVKAIGAVVRDGLWHLLTFTYDGANLRYFIDGRSVAFLAGAALAPVAVRTLFLSDDATAWLPGVLAYVTFYNVAHDEAKVANQLLAYNAALSGRGINIVPSIYFLAAEGDSITDGTGRTPYPTLAAIAFGETQCQNFASTGSTMTDVNTRASDVDAALTDGTNIISVLIGTNDFYLGTAAVALVAQIKAYCLARRTEGWTVVACTILPTTDPLLNAYRDVVNPLIRADASFYDALCDFAADPVMGPDAAASNILLYGDGVHPTQLGQNNLGVIFETTLQELFP